MEQVLTRQQIRDIIEGKGHAYRVPISYHFWIYPGAFEEQKDTVVALLDNCPNDLDFKSVRMPDNYVAPDDDPNYRWVNKDKPEDDQKHGLDSQCAIEDWDELDDVLTNFPDPNYVGLLPEVPKPDGRYRLGTFWYCFFERLWSLRGMENALTDFYLYPDEVHRLFDALTNFYCRVIERLAKEWQADAIFISDDIGMQTGPFFSLEIFREFFKPYYKRLFDTAHANGMHFWLHACGNIELFIPELIEIGLDVLHPIQKYTMSEQRIAEQYGNDICIWAGFDVQRTIPYGTPEDVRNEVRFMLDTYKNKNGRLIMTLGNGATSDTPIESLKALFEETIEYSKKVYADID